MVINARRSTLKQSADLFGSSSGREVVRLTLRGSGSTNAQERTMTTSTASDHAHAPRGYEAPSDPLNETLARNWWLILLRGVLGILFGVLALVFPGATMLALVIVFAAYLLVDGIFAIIAAVNAARKRDRWGWLTFEGIVNIATAALAVIWPGLTVLAFVILIAAWAIVSGVLLLGAAFHLNVDHGRWWMVLGGATSVALGILMILAPLAGAVVLTWWIGAYALVFGGALLFLAFKLRRRRHDRRYAAEAQPAA
jgi:uncharacterized membrane protein HdeD (DUF308 family)